MSNFAALPSRQVTFSRPANVAQQPFQQIQQQQAVNSGLALPYSNSYLPGPSSQNNLALPVSSATSYQTQQQIQHQQPSSLYPQTQASSQNLSAASSQTAVASQPAPLAGPSTPGPSAVPATPAPLTLEQQHITAVEGIVPTLQNIVATVNLDCRLDLKTIALHARNAEYNPKVCSLSSDLCECRTSIRIPLYSVSPRLSCVSVIRRQPL